MSWEERFKRLGNLKKRQEREEEERISSRLKQLEKVMGYFDSVIKGFAHGIGSDVFKPEYEDDEWYSPRASRYSRRRTVPLGDSYIEFIFLEDRVSINYFPPQTEYTDYDYIGLVDINEPNAQEKLAEMLEEWFPRRRIGRKF